jgi:hypothetical protein
MDPSKVQDVLSWKASTSVSDIQSFFEMDKQLEWTPACEASFQELKK